MIQLTYKPISETPLNPQRVWRQRRHTLSRTWALPVTRYRSLVYPVIVHRTLANTVRIYCIRYGVCQFPLFSHITKPRPRLQSERFWLTAHIWNTRRTSSFQLTDLLTGEYYRHRMHKSAYNFFAFREWQQTIIESMRRVILQRQPLTLQIKVVPAPGFKKLAMRSFLWMRAQIRRTRRPCDIFYYIAHSHGYRTGKKIARRKRGLQKVKQKRSQRRY